MVEGRGPLSTSCLSPRLSIADLAIAWLVGDIQFVYILFWGRGRRGVLGVANMYFLFCFMGCVDLVMRLACLGSASFLLLFLFCFGFFVIFGLGGFDIMRGEGTVIAVGWVDEFGGVVGEEEVLVIVVYLVEVSLHCWRILAV